MGFAGKLGQREPGLAVHAYLDDADQQYVRHSVHDQPILAGRKLVILVERLVLRQRFYYRKHTSGVVERNVLADVDGCPGAGEPSQPLWISVVSGPRVCCWKHREPHRGPDRQQRERRRISSASGWDQRSAIVSAEHAAIVFGIRRGHPPTSVMFREYESADGDSALDNRSVRGGNHWNHHCI